MFSHDVDQIEHVYFLFLCSLWEVDRIYLRHGTDAIASFVILISDLDLQCILLGITDFSLCFKQLFANYQNIVNSVLVTYFD